MEGELGEIVMLIAFLGSCLIATGIVIRVLRKLLGPGSSFACFYVFFAGIAIIGQYLIVPQFFQAFSNWAKTIAIFYALLAILLVALYAYYVKYKQKKATS